MNIEKLTIEGAGQEFKTCDLNDLLGPGVYVVMQDDEPVYVGMGKNLLRRISGRHHKRSILASSDRILLFPCVDLAASIKLETELIGRFQPIGNGSKNWTVIAERLGVEHLSIKAKVAYRLAFRR